MKLPPSSRLALAGLFQPVRSAVLMLLVIGAVLNVLQLFATLYIIQIYDRVLHSRSVATLVVLLLIMIVAYLTSVALEAVRSRIANRIGRYVDETVGPSVLNGVIDARGQTARGEDGLTPIRDLDDVRRFFQGGSLNFMFDLPWLPVYLIVLLLIHPLIGLATIAAGVLLALVTRIASPRTEALVDRVRTQVARRNAFLQDLVSGSEVIGALGLHGAMVGLWRSRHGGLVGHEELNADRIAITGAVARFIRLVLQAGLIALGAWLVLTDQATAGVIFAASFLGLRALQPIEQLHHQWRQWIAVRASFAKLAEAIAKTEPARLALPPPHVRLELRGVAVATPDRKEVIVQGVGFSLAAGTALAIVGASASGKSTLARALVGLAEPVRGEIRLDGATLDQWSPAERGRFVGYLPQDVQLFDGTIADNIARFDADRDDAAVIEAARLAGIHDMILKMRNGYDTAIGSRGALLSAGQRQLVGIARAFYGDPFLIVLDEPNSNLDANGERRLIEAVAAARRSGAIVVLIAHRKTVLAAVDRVLVLDAGRQVSFGEKNELAAGRGAIVKDMRSDVIARIPDLNGE